MSKFKYRSFLNGWIVAKHQWWRYLTKPVLVFRPQTMLVVSVLGFAFFFDVL